MTKRDYDAIIVGSGPNGFAAAITMQQQGLSTLLIEAKSTVGGGMRSAELTLPGFNHDVCSAVFAMALSSPFFNQLPLHEFGVEYIQPMFAAAHPFDDGSAAILHQSIKKTATGLGNDATAYEKMLSPLFKNVDEIFSFVLNPLHFPKHILHVSEFGLKALQPASKLSSTFKTQQARGLFAGMSAHSMLPFTKTATAAVALVLMLAAHNNGWPVIKGGSQKMADGLAGYYTSIGGTIETNFHVTSMQQLPSSHAVLLDVGPKQLLQIAGNRLSSFYKNQLNHFKYGMGVFKVDYALSEAVPFKNEDCRKAGTIHIGNTYNEIASSERDTWNGKHPEKPFVLLVQPSSFDPTRAPDNKHTVWTYCHVPNGSAKNISDNIAQQVERFAPGFRDCIIANHEMNCEAMQEYNSNYIGGDINGGAQLISQLFTRPALRLSPYRTSSKGLYICSSSTPPGGGVHGMCGYNASRKALKDVFKIEIN